MSSIQNDNKKISLKISRKNKNPDISIEAEEQPKQMQHAKRTLRLPNHQVRHQRPALLLSDGSQRRTAPRAASLQPRQRRLRPVPPRRPRQLPQRSLSSKHQRIKMGRKIIRPYFAL